MQIQLTPLDSARLRSFVESTFPQLVIVFCESQLSWVLGVQKTEGVCHESHESHMFVAVKMQMAN